MREILKRIALAVAGMSALAGSATAAETAEAPRQLHDVVRTRVIHETSSQPTSLEAIRTALGQNPHFNLLLEYFRLRSMGAVRDRRHEDDAMQETLLKIWRSRPDIFLKPHDEVLKYVQASVKRNLITEIQRSQKKSLTLPIEGDEFERPGNSDPAEQIAQEDFLEELRDRLGDVERQVLETHLDGVHSQRKIASAHGLTRYAATQSNDRIRQALEEIAS